MHSKPLAKLNAAIQHLENATARLHEAFMTQRALQAFGPEDPQEDVTTAHLEARYHKAETLLLDLKATARSL